MPKSLVIQLAQKKNMPLDTWVGYWRQTAVVQDETIEWMTRRLSGKNSVFLIAQFGKFLEKTKPGEEPTLDEIQAAMQ